MCYICEVAESMNCWEEFVEEFEMFNDKIDTLTKEEQEEEYFDYKKRIYMEELNLI